MPVFDALPAKLKPPIEKTDSTSGVLIRTFSASRNAVLVYSSDAPAGACTSVMNHPASCSGRNACGTR